MRKILVPLQLWLKLMYGLKVRGQGRRESGGLLLCKQGESKVSKIVFYDQFDKSVSDSGIIEFKGAVFLFDFLAKENLEILADIHSHPTNNTSQSYSDMQHPIVRIKGHIAIIAPNYAKDFIMFPKHCSAYEFLGELSWRKFTKKENSIQISVF
jgi:proteasome lid subunit RPN8/RPN11